MKFKLQVYTEYVFQFMEQLTKKLSCVFFGINIISNAIGTLTGPKCNEVGKTNEVGWEMPNPLRATTYLFFIYFYWLSQTECI